jgi:hypothetical protein
MTKLLYTTAALMLFTTGAMACEGCTPTYHSEYSHSTFTPTDTHKNDGPQATTLMIGNWVNASASHTMMQGSGGNGGGGNSIRIDHYKDVPDNNCESTGKNRS